VTTKGASVTITWTTDVPATSAVRYGVNGATDQVASDPALVTTHSVKLTNLARKSTYTFVVESAASGLTSTSGPGTFTTK
jgi:hypothetical protein